MGLVLHVILSLFIILSYHCFYIFKYPNWLSSLTWIYNFSLVVFFVTIFYLILYWKSVRKCSWIFHYICLLMICISLIFIYSYYKYPFQPMFDTIRVAAVFLMPICSVLFLIEFSLYNRFVTFLQMVNILSLFWNILIIVQSIVYAKKGLILDFSSYFIGDDVYVRNNTIRISTGILSEYMIIYNFSALYNKKLNKSFSYLFHLIAFVIGIYCIFFVAQSRADEVYVFVSLCTILFVGDGSLKHRVITFLVFISGLFIIYFSDIFSSFLSTFNPSGEYQNGTTHRLYAIEYYIEIILNNPIFGNGFALTTNRSQVYYYVEHGIKGWAYYSDVGFLGLLANVGIFSFVVYIIPIFRQFQVLTLLSKRNCIVESLFLLGSFVYTLLSSFSLISTDATRMLQFAFIIALYETVYMKLMNKQEIKLYSWDK